MSFKNTICSTKRVYEVYIHISKYIRYSNGIIVGKSLLSQICYSTGNVIITLLGQLSVVFFTQKHA